MGGAVSLNHMNWGVPQREITRLLSREGPEQQMAQTTALNQNPFPFLGLNVEIVTVIAVSPLPSFERCKSYFHFGYLMNYSVKLVFLVGCCFVCLFVCLLSWQCYYAVDVPLHLSAMIHYVSLQVSKLVLS